MKLPTLARPVPGETLFLYIAVSQSAVSAVLLREQDKIQQPVYFVSHALTGAETRYPMIEKAAYAVITAARRLRPYFDAHPITVLTDLPLEKSLERIENFGRLTNWALELTGFGITLQPRTTIKAQALADFLAECSNYEEHTTQSDPWTVYTDGFSTDTGSGAGVVLLSSEKDVIEYALKFQF